TLIECPSTGSILKVPYVSQEMTVERFMTRRYAVPPFFATIDSGNSGEAAPDPFAEDALLMSQTRPTASEILKSKGIDLEEGGNAYFDEARSELSVTSTPEKLELVDEFVANLIGQAIPKQIKVGPGFVEIREN
ncbi:MAG: hypothetical protein ACKVHP_23860, partial [Verrucomicrobiales bacterium]